ncbi:unnamed protein product [Prorocentrum cordatum]|uniref:Uncharacterized protein n=1 Tax=Prorocentrum cordatum TaxID=2364126 RepID=A0ABN9R336_9DINO|nr:unnamed protein product [Polarella glacialis]
MPMAPAGSAARPPLAVFAAGLAWISWRAAEVGWAPAGPWSPPPPPPAVALAAEGWCLEGAPAWLEAVCPPAQECPACPARARPQVDLPGHSETELLIWLVGSPLLTHLIGLGPVELREGILRGLRACETECRVGQRPVMPELARDPGGELAPIVRLFGGSFPPMRSRPPSMAIGSEVGVRRAPFVEATSGHGLAFLDEGYARAVQMRIEDIPIPAYAETRAAGLRQLLGAASAGAGVGLRDRLGRPPLSGPEETPSAAEAVAPIEGEDVRLLAADFDGQGERFKPWREAVHEITQEEFSDQPLDAPPSALATCKSMPRVGVAHELRCICEDLYMAGCYDQVNLGGLMVLEVLCNRLAGIVAARSNPQRVQWELAKYYTAGFQGAGGRPGLAASRGQRGLFPLPLLAPDSACPGRGRGRLSMASDALKALNWMAGSKGLLWADRGPDVVPDSMQADAQGRVRELADSWHPRPSHLSDEAALRKLLQGHSPCRAAGCPTRATSSKLDLVSLLGSVQECTLIRDVAPLEVIGFLEDYQERMLAPSIDVYETAPYFDPVLKFNQKVGLFTVEKDGGAAQRLIVDARRANECFKAPPGVSPLCSEELSRVGVELPADAPLGSERAVELLSDFYLAVGLSDVSNCFHRLRVPAWLSESVGRALEQLGGGFNRESLLLHKSELSRAGIVALGTELDGTALRTRVTPQRLWNIYAALEELLRRKRASAWSVQVVLGHCTFAALCCRGLLSVFHSVRALVERGQSLMIFVVSDRLRCWNDLVVQIDSSLEGYAVAQAFWPLDAVREVGRTSERQRFRRVGSHRARESALETAGFRQQAGGGWSVASGADEWDCDEPPSEAARDWEVDDQSFPEVPASLLKPDLRRLVRVQKWKRVEGILIKEARALVKGHASLANQRRTTLRPQDVQLALRDRLGCSRQELALPENDEQLSRGPTLADVGESSSTDDEARPGPGAGRRAVLKRRGHQRRRKFLDLALATAALGTTTFFEPSSVTPKVLERCETEVGGFIGFVGSRPLVRDEKADATLVDYFNFLFSIGWDANKGEQVPAGPVCLAPEFSRAAWRLVERGLLQMAAFLLVSSGAREESVWTFTYPQYLMEFKAALAELEISETIGPYQTMHSGPSIDIARRYRTASEAARRDAPLAGHFKGRYILDLYSGTAGVARAAVQQGRNARAFDRARGPAEDMTSDRVLSRLGAAIRRGEVLGAAMGPPCDDRGGAAEHGVVVEVPQVEFHKLTNLVPKVTVVEEPTLVDVPYVQTVTEARPNLVRQDLQRHVPRLTVREELQVVPKPVTRVVEETVQVPVASPPRPIVHIKAKVDVVEDVQQVKVPTQVISSEEVVEVPYDLYVVREEVHLKPQIERIVKDVVIPYAQEEIVEVPEERVSTRVVEVPQFTTIVNRRHIPSFVNGTGKPSPAVTREAMAAQEAHEERLWVEVNELRVKNEQLAEHCSQQKLELEQCHARVNAMVDDLSEEKRKQFELSVKLKAASGHSYAGIVTTVVKQAYSPTAPAACGDSCAPTSALLDQVPHRGAAAAADPVPHDACRADASA